MQRTCPKLAQDRTKKGAVDFINAGLYNSKVKEGNKEAIIAAIMGEQKPAE